MPEAGLRERKKARTRRVIADAAARLFAEHGFEHVTVDQVAIAADVAKKTVFNYFPTKEDLVFDRAEVIIASLADAVAARAPGESLLAAVRRDYAERIAAGDVTLGVPTLAFARMVGGSHALTSRRREIADLAEQALAAEIAAETGGDSPRQRIVAAQLAAVHRVLFEEGTRRILAGEPYDEIGPALGEAARAAFDLLEPSLGGYCVRA